MARVAGHKRGCRCVACSPRTRAKGKRALRAWIKSGGPKRAARKRRANPAGITGSPVMREVHALAHDMARRGYSGAVGEPLPVGVSGRAVSWINENLEAFRELVAIAKREAVQRYELETRGSVRGRGQRRRNPEHQPHPGPSVPEWWKRGPNAPPLKPFDWRKNNPRQLTFKALALGDVFEFATSGLGFERGPWTKTSARTYAPADPGHRLEGHRLKVGSINVAVERVTGRLELDPETGGTVWDPLGRPKPPPHFWRIMQQTFGEAWEVLDPEERLALLEDLQTIVTDEQRASEDAAKVLRSRIGGPGNLSSYAATLVAGRRRRENPGGARASLAQNEAGYWDGYRAGRLDRYMGAEPLQTALHAGPSAYGQGYSSGYRDGYYNRPDRGQGGPR